MRSDGPECRRAIPQPLNSSAVIPHAVSNGTFLKVWKFIASFDYLKRRDGAFREVQNLRFSVLVCDECHHLADNTRTDDIADRHRLAQWASKAADALLLLSATPHSGYDESFVSLLNLLEPTLVAKARELGAVTYVPTIDRRRATFVERACRPGRRPDAGRGRPDAGDGRPRPPRKSRSRGQVATRDGVVGRTPDPHAAADETRDRGTAPVSVDAPAD